MTIGITGATNSGTSTSANFKAVKGTDKDFAAILEAFKKAAAQTPAERARETVLRKHEMSEEDYEALPQAKRKAIDREIADMVRKTTEQRTGVPLSELGFDMTRFLG